MTEEEARRRLVEEAKTWIGTRYHHAGDVKGIGVDCGMLLVRIFVDLGLVEPFDPRPYPPDFMMHSNEELYVDLVRRCGGIEFPGPPKPGDVVIWRHGRVYSHGAIVVAWPNIIHAFAKAHTVIPDDVTMCATLHSAHHPYRFFSLWP